MDESLENPIRGKLGFGQQTITKCKPSKDFGLWSKLTNIREFRTN